ncbi:MAG TPA: aminoglycoside adenylyltransferase domain-containing protein [Gaiellales bacterium]|nr:aminoglycoside adenylyltransferase domain-containing protein [Gaiellales bacterium]
MTPEAEACLKAVVAALHRCLGPGLVGAYLHGSAVLGGWRPDRSDVDVLAVCARPPGRAALEDLGAALSVEEVGCPAAGGLEFGLVTSASAADPVPEPPFELDVNSMVDGERVTIGAGRGHADYLMHFAVCREHAKALVGSPPPEVFAPVPVVLLDAAFADELAWAADNASPTYQVLNACRAWRFAAERALGSKIAGGEWALRHGADPALVRPALARQAGGPEPALDPAAVAALLARATDELGAAAEYPHS